MGDDEIAVTNTKRDAHQKLMAQDFVLSEGVGLRGAVQKDNINHLSNQNYYEMPANVNGESFRRAGINITTLRENNSQSRPGIGFERVGIEGAFLYYEDGKFCYCDHHGDLHRITST